MPGDIRPSVFIGSSTEGLDIARMVQLNLDHECDSAIWSQGIFGLNEGTLESLVGQLDSIDFAILVLTPDDLVEARGETSSAPRDNVLFELGLFMGGLGKDRTFTIHDRTSNLKLPSDLGGVTTATFKPHANGNLQAALGAPCTRILEVMRKLGPRRKLQGIQKELAELKAETAKLRIETANLKVRQVSSSALSLVGLPSHSTIKEFERALETLARNPRISLRNGNDSISVSGSYKYKQSARSAGWSTAAWTAKPTWNEIFSIVGPPMFTSASAENDLRARLSRLLSKRDSSDVYGLRLNDLDWDKIKIQLHALELVTSRLARSTDGTSVDFWSLTPQGKDLVVTLLADQQTT